MKYNLYNAEVKKITKDEYPDYLKKRFEQFEDYPETLYYIGDLGALNQEVTAVIGSRYVGEDMLKLAYYQGTKEAQAGHTVLNGLAIGCDTRALEGALAKNGKTVAVMPCGLNNIYPKQNLELAIRIVENGGLIISQYEYDYWVNTTSFLERDRLQVMLADSVYAVAMGNKGGTFYTFNYAIRNGIKAICLERI